MVHSREYDETPEGRICAEAREIIIWMYHEQKKRNPHLEYPPVPDYRDFYDHLSPIILVEILRVQVAASNLATLQDSVLRYQLNQAELALARERAMRIDRTSVGKLLHE